MTQATAQYYRETIRFEENTSWKTASVHEDPWVWEYDDARPAAPVAHTYSLTGIDEISPVGPPAVLETEVWGASLGNHRVTVSINGSQIQDFQFTGRIAQEKSSQISSGILQSGPNSVTYALPGNAGADSDTVALEALTVEYSRKFVAQNGALSFSGDAGLFKVDGLPSNQVTVFSYFRNRLWRMDEVVVNASGSTYTATFPGWGEPAEYYVLANNSFATPGVKAGQLPVDITTGQFDFVIISHPNFLSGLQSLVTARTAEGFRVKVVNVLDVYAQYSDSIFDAYAIKDYIKHAIVDMGADHFLLVGGDVNDYHNYAYPGVQSYIPSLYAPVYQGATDQNFMPVDPLYTDIDGDTIMDAAIGRFPVRTPSELTAIVNKTLAYSTQGRTALFTADFHDGPDYTGYSRGFASELPL